MNAWRLSSAAKRRLLPDTGLRGPTPWVLAIMMFVTVSVAAAALSLANAAQLVASGAERGYSVQLDGGSATAADIARTVAAIPGVTSARPVGESEMRETLERWLGAAALADELPLPMLVDVELAPGADERAVARAVSTQIPGAELTGHGAALGPLLSAMRSLILLAWGLVLLMAAATGAAVVLAARGALDTYRSTIEIMHGIGATDEQIAQLFQRRIALDAFAGGVAGAASAGLVLLVIVGNTSSLVGDLAGRAALGLRDIAILAALPLAGTLLATIVARQTVLRSLKHNL